MNSNTDDDNPTALPATSPESTKFDTTDGLNRRRGLLDIKINLSNPEPTAGSDFTVYVLVTNPFDDPIWLLPPQVFLPSEIKLFSESFQDSVQNLSFLLSQAARNKVSPVWDGLENPFRLGKRLEMQDILRRLAKRAIRINERIVELENELERIEAEKQRRTEGKTFSQKEEMFETDPDFQKLYERASKCIQNIADFRSDLIALTTQIVVLTGGTSITSDGDLTLSNVSSNARIYVQAKGDVTVKLATTQLVTLTSSLDPETALQPGNTAVYSIALRTTETLFFRPIQYVLQYSLNFSFTPNRSVLHTNICAQTLTIRAPIVSVMIGASIGGFAGAAANILQTYDPVTSQTPQMGITLLISVILSAMAVVFLARKSDTQSLVSVEDFWGGLVIGFLVGYTGTSVFDNLAGTGDIAILSDS